MGADITFKLVLQTVRKKLLPIILASLLTTGIAGGITLMQKPVYASTAKYISINISNDRYTSSSLVAAQQASVDDYIEIIKSDKMLDKVAETLNAGGDKNYTSEALLKMISPSKISNTSTFTVTARSTDPEEAERIIGAITENIQEVIDSSTKRVNSVNVLSKGSEAKKVSPVLSRSLITGAVVGAVASAIIFVMISAYDCTIRTEDDLKKRFDLPVIGNIPTWERPTERS